MAPDFALARASCICTLWLSSVQPCQSVCVRQTSVVVHKSKWRRMSARGRGDLLPSFVGASPEIGLERSPRREHDSDYRAASVDSTIRLLSGRGAIALHAAIARLLSSTHPTNQDFAHGDTEGRLVSTLRFSGRVTCRRSRRELTRSSTAPRVFPQ